MEILLGWLLLASVQLAATMSPGPAFVVAVRNAMAYSRGVGLCTALGLSLGVMAHVVFVLVGISYLIAKSVFLFSLIKYAGAAYLFYIGVKALRSAKRIKLGDGEGVAVSTISLYRAVQVGFLTNLLNPKAVVFYTAVFTQFIGDSTPFSVQLLYGATAVVIEFLWFVGVAVVLTNQSVKRRFMDFIHYVERICGGLMIVLSLKLVLLK